MSGRFIYAATESTYTHRNDTPIDPDPPSSDDGESDWELVSAIPQKTYTVDGVENGVIWYWVIWYWKKEV